MTQEEFIPICEPAAFCKIIWEELGTFSMW